MSPIRVSLAVLCVVAFASSCLAAAGPSEDLKKQEQQRQAKNYEMRSDGNPESDDGPIWSGGEPGSEPFFLAGNECPLGEEHRPGLLPTCEPTCSNTSVVCPKIFFVSQDHVKCFCKDDTVRNEKTGKCVRLEECPKAS